jgi:hypothetical protein
MKRGLCALLLLGALALSTRSQGAPMTLEDLVRSAGTILAGRVLDVREERHPRYPYLIVTRVTLAVERTFKGGAGASSRRFTFRQIGGLTRFRILDLPGYRVGEELVLFLYPESAYGLTSPVGGMAGKFRLFVDPQTNQRVVVNEFDALLSSQRLAARSERGLMEYETFALRVAHMASALR